MTRQTPLSEFAQRNMPGGGWAVVCLGVITLVMFYPFLFAIVVIPEAVGRVTVWLLFALVAGVVTVLVAWHIYSRRTPIYNQNHLDYQGGQVIQAELPAVIAGAPRSTLNIDTTQQEVSAYQGMQLGEVNRHFDSQTSASIEGWLNHNLQVSGRSVSYQRELSGYRYYDQKSVGEYGGNITGQSSVHLTFSGTTRDNLLADGFVAVLEQETVGGWMDTLRVIVPSELAMREYVQQYIASMGQAFEPGSHRAEILSRSASTLAQRLNTDVSYVSDRLSAILRMPSEKRPAIAVVGTAVTAHAIVGGAIQFGNDGNWYQLFPISLVQKMNALVERSASQPCQANQDRRSEAPAAQNDRQCHEATTRLPVFLEKNLDSSLL